MQELYNKIIQKYAEKYSRAEFAESGTNGPYFKEESFVRTTAHWTITFSIMYRLTQETRYQDIVKRFSQSLVKTVEQSPNGVVVCIPKAKEPFSQTNGLIGLAWLIEGLVEAYEVLADQTLLDAAEKVFFSQEYDFRLHAWEIIEPDGKNLGVDKPFNHELWFCMAAAKLVQQRQNEEIDHQIRDYMLYMRSQFTVYRTGLLSHNGLKIGEWKRDLKAQLRRVYCAVTKEGVSRKRRDKIEYERAYHLFSLYAFAWLYLFYPEANIFHTKKFAKLKQFGLTEEHFISFPEKNEYAYGYNSPAYELPFIEYIFGTGNDEQCAERFLGLHQQYNIAFDGNSYTDNVPDAVTLDARIYEIMQYYKLKELHYGKKG